MKLSIIVPFHNEKENIPAVLSEYKNYIGRYDFELICVDDGSGDGSQAVFTRILQGGGYGFVKLIEIDSRHHRGYGYAIMTGVREASGGVIAWTHSDLQTDPADVFRAYDMFLRQENKRLIVKGNRIKRSLGQVIFSFGMAAVASLVLGKRFFEINAQPKLFPRSFIAYLSSPPDDFSLDLYLLYKAKENGFAIKTIDVYFKKRVHGQSSWAYSFLSKAKTILRTIKYILKLRSTL